VGDLFFYHPWSKGYTEGVLSLQFYLGTVSEAAGFANAWVTLQVVGTTKVGRDELSTNRVRHTHRLP
jgi:hypothetical protein